jgi:hypothetical protein
VSSSGSSYSAPPGTEVNFGRAATATIQIGSHDRHVHRRAGSFRWVAGYWELHNDGTTTTLQVNLDGGLEARIAVGAHPLIIPSGAHGNVRVLTPTPYDIEFSTPVSTVVSGLPEPTEDDLEGLTIDPRNGLGLNETETLMLVALCEPRLRDSHLPAFTIPSTKDLCSRLDITPKKAEDLVDSLVTKLASHVDGVIGSNDGRAVNRRHRIAAFAIDTRCVTVQDLRLLDRQR